jgi:3-hydroxyisobutyrate dehydrogenase/2-hydroxy-3-oxopropionate reductase
MTADPPPDAPFPLAPPVAVIGLGAMGSRIAARFLEAGHETIVWNRSAAKAQQLASRGAIVAETPADAARQAAFVITMVADPGALRAVTAGPDGVLAGAGGAGSAGSAGSATVLMEMSTVGPAAVAWLAAALPEGVGLLDTPVLGSLGEAEAGALTVFVGGPDPLVERAVPVLRALGRPVHVGPLGSGAAAKLVANSTLLAVLGVLGEAVALADGLGLTRDAAFEVLSVTPLAPQAGRRREAIESGAYPHRFTLSLARKDAELVVEAATAAGVGVRHARAALSWLADAENAGRGKADYSAVLAHIIDAARPGAPGARGDDGMR